MKEDSVTIKRTVPHITPRKERGTGCTGATYNILFTKKLKQDVPFSEHSLDVSLGTFYSYSITLLCYYNPGVLNTLF